MHKEAPHRPILIVTMLASADARQKFLDEGALDYLIEPLDGAALGWMRGLLEHEFPELQQQLYSEHRI